MSAKEKHKKALEWRSYEHAKTEAPKMIIVIAKCVSGVSPSEAATSRLNLAGQPSKGTSALAPVSIQSQAANTAGKRHGSHTLV